jgi:hypothetical protein
MNRDMLYSFAIFDLDAAPVSVTLPDAGKRFMLMQVLAEDHYTIEVVYAVLSHLRIRQHRAGSWVSDRSSRP